MDLHRRVLADTAGLLGAATATVVDAGGLPMLCLSQVVALRSANPCWSLNAIDREEGPAAAPVEALALAASPMSEHRFLVGLWTAEHGYLHTGEVTVDVRSTEPEPAGEGIPPTMDSQAFGSTFHQNWIEPDGPL